MLQLLAGRSGLLWLARLALTLQIVVLAWRLPPAGRGPARMWWALLAIGGVIVLTLSLRSHAAASPAATIAVPLDWLHLAAMIAWLGGLLPLAFAIRVAGKPERSSVTADTGQYTPIGDRSAGIGVHLRPSAVANQTASDEGQALPERELLAYILPRFSRMTIACVAILTLTGIYSYVLHVGALDLLAATTYGRALLSKLGFFGVLLLLGGLNLFVLARRKSPRAIGRSVRWELVAGALLLLAAGVMTSVAPSKDAWEAHERQGIAQSAQVGDVGLTLRIAPAQVGDNEFAVDIVDRRPGAAAAPTKVRLGFDMLGMAMGEIQAETQPAGAERYLARGSFTSMGGRWRIEVLLRRAGFDDVRHTFEVDIVSAAPFVIGQ
jgi:copper transport protein